MVVDKQVKENVEHIIWLAKYRNKNIEKIHKH